MPAHHSDYRYAETDSLQISSGFIVEAELVIGCHDDQVWNNPTTEVHLEYSTDHGKTWNLVYEVQLFFITLHYKNCKLNSYF